MLSLPHFNILPGRCSQTFPKHVLAAYQKHCSRFIQNLQHFVLAAIQHFASISFYDSSKDCLRRNSTLLPRNCSKTFRKLVLAAIQSFCADIFYKKFSKTCLGHFSAFLPRISLRTFQKLVLVSVKPFYVEIFPRFLPKLASPQINTFAPKLLQDLTTICRSRNSTFCLNNFQLRFQSLS